MIDRPTSLARRELVRFLAASPYVAAMGGIGAFSVLNLLFPDLVRSVYELCERGAFVEAMPLQHKVSALLITIKKYKMHAAVKALLEMQGLPIGLPRQPNLPLGPDEKQALVATLKEIGVWPMERWG